MRLLGVGAAVCGSMLMIGTCAGQAPAQPDAPAQPATPAAPAASVAAPAQPKPLNLGDPAPALSIAEWIKGQPVKSFEKGHAYVVEFWATWCGPCRAGMPHLTKLQEKYADKKLTLISVSVDQGGVDVVRNFVEKNTQRMGYTVALDNGGATNAAYMQATGSYGIPHAFVVDKDGKMVWHCNPVVPTDGLDLIVQEVVDGTFDLKKAQDRQTRFADADQRYAKAAGEQRWDDAEKLLDEIVTLRPDLTPNLTITHLWIKMQTPGNEAKAIAYAKQVADKELKDDGEMLAILADKLLSIPTLTPDEMTFTTGVARKAVEKTKGRSATAQIVLSEALKKEGKLDEALAAAQSAADATIEPIEQRYYQGKVDELKALKEKKG